MVGRFKAEIMLELQLGRQRQKKGSEFSLVIGNQQTASKERDDKLFFLK
jgi:hypothetical protein